MTRDDEGTAADRIETALELAELAEEMVECRLRRERTEASEDEIERALSAWYATRTGAAYGDAEGRPIPWPRR